MKTNRTKKQSSSLSSSGYRISGQKIPFKTNQTKQLYVYGGNNKITRTTKWKKDKEN